MVTVEPMPLSMELLKPLKPEPYEMRLYADLKVQANCHVELRQDTSTHFSSSQCSYLPIVNFS